VKELQLLNETKIQLDASKNYFVGGRVDGFVDGRLIEIKNRTNRIGPEPPWMDVMQIQTYLYILGLDEGELIERLSQASQSNNKSTIIKRDHTEWNTYTLPSLAYFCHTLEGWLGKTDQHPEYFAKPEIFLENLFKDLAILQRPRSASISGRKFWSKKPPTTTKIPTSPPTTKTTETPNPANNAAPAM